MNAGESTFRDFLIGLRGWSVNKNKGSAIYVDLRLTFRTKGQSLVPIVWSNLATTGGELAAGTQGSPSCLTCSTTGIVFPGVVEGGVILSLTLRTKGQSLVPKVLSSLTTAGGEVAAGRQGCPRCLTCPKIGVMCPRDRSSGVILSFTSSTKGQSLVPKVWSSLTTTGGEVAVGRRLF